jgi:hypothetical protein
MNPDVMLTLGLIFSVISIPAILGATSDGRNVRFPLLLLVGGLALTAVALNEMPRGFEVADIPAIVTRAIDHTFN